MSLLKIFDPNSPAPLLSIGISPFNFYPMFAFLSYNTFSIRDCCFPVACSSAFWIT